jgi:hypothetical protein
MQKSKYLLVNEKIVLKKPIDWSFRPYMLAIVDITHR